MEQLEYGESIQDSTGEEVNESFTQPLPTVAHHSDHAQMYNFELCIGLPTGLTTAYSLLCEATEIMVNICGNESKQGCVESHYLRHVWHSEVYSPAII